MIRLFFVVILLSCSVVWADLRARIDGILDKTGIDKSQVSVQVLNADSGKVAYTYNGNKAVIPASNMKVVTTAAALKFLGKDFEFVTKVGLSGKKIVVIGSGDSLLGDPVIDAEKGRRTGWIFEDIVQKLRAQDVNLIDGIIIDSTVFEDQRVHPNWPKEQLNKWYACEISGLNYYDNCIDITVKNVMGRAAISAIPQTQYVKIINEVDAISKDKGAVGAYRNSEMNKIVVKGRCRNVVGPFSVAIERPAAFFGFILGENLLNSGFKVSGELEERDFDKGRSFKQLSEYKTSIKEAMQRANKNSLGLAAECLFKTISAKKGSGKGSWDDGRAVISKYLSGLGVDENEYYIDDGSGLSRENKLSANVLTKVLFDVYKSDDWKFYKDTLAIGGVDGTLKKHFSEAKYKGKVFGKTGYIAGVKSLSGVCETSKGDFIFSILINKANGRSREAINDIVKAVINEQAGK